jgi:hypothetical protein
MNLCDVTLVLKNQGGHLPLAICWMLCYLLLLLLRLSVSARPYYLRHSKLVQQSAVLSERPRALRAVSVPAVLFQVR